MITLRGNFDSELTGGCGGGGGAYGEAREMVHSTAVVAAGTSSDRHGSTGSLSTIVKTAFTI